MPVDDDNGLPPENVTILHPKKKRPKFTPSLLELGRVLREDPDLGEGTMFRLDLFSGETLLMRPVPRPGVKPGRKKHKPRDTTDVDITHLMEWLIDNGAKKDPSRSTVDAAVQAEADRNEFSSAQEALDRLPAWDGVYRLDKFWSEVCGAQLIEEGMDDLQSFRRQRYLAATAKCFFISIIARILRPGCKVDSVVILEGPQGSLKSTLLRVICLDKDEWFSDSMVTDLGSKDARQHLRGKLIIEMAEMSQLKGSKVESLKAFLSAQDDKYRPSYGRRDIMHKRQCVFIGTTNHDDYLVDLTGNRRFWPIRCGEINISKARELMPQLYAEAIAAFYRGEQWWLPAEVELLAEAEQRDRLTDDPWEKVAAELVADKKNSASSMYAWVTTAELLQRVITLDRQDRAAEMRAGTLLVKLGGRRAKLPRDRGWPRRGFRFDP